MTLLLESLATDPFPPLQEPPPRMRASDADREAVVRILLDALARGLLTLDEGDERVAAAYAARYLDELPRLTADLPPAPATAPAAPGWRALASLIWLQVRTTARGPLAPHPPCRACPAPPGRRHARPAGPAVPHRGHCGRIGSRRELWARRSCRTAGTTTTGAATATAGTTTTTITTTTTYDDDDDDD